MRYWFVNLHWFKKLLIHLFVNILFFISLGEFGMQDIESRAADIWMGIVIALLVLETLLIKWSRKKYKSKLISKRSSKTIKQEKKSCAETLTVNATTSSSTYQEPRKAKTHLDNVTITDSNGKSEEVPSYCVITDSDKCLYSEGGKTYHTHTGCYLNWSKEMQNGFEGWKLISKQEAESMGLRKCRFCEEADLSPEERFKRKYGDRHYITAKLGRTGKAEIQENLTCTNEGEDLSISFDYDSDSDNDSYKVEDKFGNCLGYLNQGTIHKLENYTDDIDSLDAIVHSVDLNDNMKYEIKILIFTD